MIIRCRNCGATLGQRIAGRLIITHRNREIIIELPAHVVQTCHVCGTVNEMGDCRPVSAAAWPGAELAAE